MNENGPKKISDEEAAEILGSISEESHDQITMCVECLAEVSEERNPILMLKFFHHCDVPVHCIDLAMNMLNIFVGMVDTIYEAQGKERPTKNLDALKALRGDIVMLLPKDRDSRKAVLDLDSLWVTDTPEIANHKQTHH